MKVVRRHYDVEKITSLVHVLQATCLTVPPGTVDHLWPRLVIENIENIDLRKDHSVPGIGNVLM